MKDRYARRELPANADGAAGAREPSCTNGTDAPARKVAEHLNRDQNAFGFLRLLFASLVIVSHATELFDGNRDREPLTRLFGTISFGDLGVDGFFLISGYLIVASYLRQPSAVAYLIRRAARIYPGFLIASIFCLAVIAPIAGADPGWLIERWPGMVLRLAFLQPPRALAFVALPFPQLNGAMWTIAYEFRCYLLVLVLGALGCFRRPWDIALLAAASLFLFELVSPATSERLTWVLPYSKYWLGKIDETLRFSGMFLMGALFYLLRERIRLTGLGTFLAAILLLLCLMATKLAEPAVATFGGYIIFAVARWGGSNRLAQVNHKVDVSYGVYLYAWPITQLLVLTRPEMSPVWAGTITFMIALCCGWISWRFFEKPFIVMARRRTQQKSRRNSYAQAVAS